MPPPDDALTVSSPEPLVNLPCMADITLTYYLEILSSWCHWAEPAWTDLKARYAGRVQFEWKIALMNPGDFPVSRAQCDWFYRRSGTIMRSPYMLNSAGSNRNARPLPCAQPGCRGRPRSRLHRRPAATCTDPCRRPAKGGRSATWRRRSPWLPRPSGWIRRKLRARAESAGVRARVDASTAEFHAHQITQRPAFVLTGRDRRQGGVFRPGARRAAGRSHRGDARRLGCYATHAAHFGQPPAA